MSADFQPAIVAAIREQGLSLAQTRKLVNKINRRKTIAPNRGAPVTRVQYVTTKAKIMLTFCKQSVTNDEIVAALEEARDKASPTKAKLNIERSS